MYFTDKIGVAAFCIAKGYKLQGLQPLNNPRRPTAVAFVFDELDQAQGDALYREFYGRGLICAENFEQALIAVKRALAERKGGYTRRPLAIQPNYFSDGGAR
jgi:hypothetical protein